MERSTSAGQGLARRYHDEVVAPLLRRRRPALAYAAGRLGSGSDVLGFDDDTSRDHDWGLRLTVLVDDGESAADVRALLDSELPDSFAGLPTRFATSWSPAEGQRIDVHTVDDFVASRLGLSPAELDDPVAWLALTGQSVLEVVAGPVFCDGSGRLSEVRERLRWYPEDVWRYVVACGWHRLSQELPFVGRCAESGDDAGSRIVAARVARDVMHLAFLVEREWAPYPKWMGTRFRQLDIAERVLPPLQAALEASGWREREGGLASAIEAVASRQRDAGIPTADVVVVPFWDRPYRTVDERYARRLLAGVDDPRISDLPLGVGSIEQWVDNVDVLAHPERRASLHRAWRQSLL